LDDCQSTGCLSPAEASAARRFVQFPTDVERSPANKFHAALSHRVALKFFRPAQRDECVAALLVLLQRYAQQDNIALDLFGLMPERVALDLEIPGEIPVSTLIDKIRVALQVAVSPKVSRSAPANIAATFAEKLCSDPDEGRYDVHFIVTPGDISVVYNAELLRPTTVSRLLESYVILLSTLLSDPVTAIQQLPLLSPGAIAVLATELDGETAFYPAMPIHRLFSEQAKRRPAALAALFEGHRLTYGELDERSNRLAHHLLACGVEPGDAVAVCVRPSLDIVVAMLAIWKARGIYLPLDPTHPEALIGRMLNEAQPRLVLSCSALAGLTASLPQFHFDRDADLLERQEATAPPIESDLADPATLFYTSGTTGRSKGVVTTQANLIQYIHSARRKYGFYADDIFVSLARYTFSISLFELVSPLCCGASLKILARDDVLSPVRLCRALKDVTVLHAGPSLLGSLFRHLRSNPSASCRFLGMRHASSGGDMVTPAVMEEMGLVFPNAELFVIYGCSEISCMGTTYPIDRERPVSRTLVGKPFPNVTLRLLDSVGNAVPYGVAGEIYFAGNGVALGYLDRPELTAEKFAEIDGLRFYRTGDIGRLHEDGNLEFLGRRDFQIQLRGIRIELAGIESVVQQLGLAAQCAVVARPSEDGEMRLVAFVVKPRNERIATFRRALALELPDYMLPHQVAALDAMPLTANGKLDRNHLRDMPIEMQREFGAGGLPKNERERQIAVVFARVLGLREVGTEDDFFDLGGDSLLGALALTQIEQAIGIAIPPSALFENATVRALAADRSGGASVEATESVLLNERTSGPPLFMLSGVHIYRELARRLDGYFATYGVFSPHELGAFDPDGEFQTVEDLAQDYIKSIRRRQPAGPYRLLGYSFSGIIAYEVAHQLERAGEKVEMLVLIDSHLPEWSAGWKGRLSMLSRLRFSTLRGTASFLRRRLRERSAAEYGGAQVYYDDKELGLWEVRRGVANYNTVAGYLPRLRSWKGKVVADRIRYETA
jgi:amino acid adenylation domain-containing protein